MTGDGYSSATSLTEAQTAQGMAIFSPAIGTPNTVVCVPLNRRLALVGMLEAELPQQELDRDGVASKDSMSTMYASQFYASEPDFVWTMRDYTVDQVNDLWQALAQQEGTVSE